MTREELQNLSETLGEMPIFINRLTSGISSDKLKRKPSEKEFSIQEHIWHQRDIERKGYAVRIEKLLTEDYPTLEDINGEQLAAEREYNNLDFAEGLAEFTQARIKNVSMIKELLLEQVSYCGTFDGSGDVTLEKLLLMMRDHDEEHRKELNNLAGL